MRLIEENIHRRKLQTQPGGAAFLEETEDDRRRIREENLRAQIEAEGGYPIHADEARVQAFRHQTGQLESLKNLDWKDYEKEAQATQKRINEQEMRYYQRTGAQMPPFIKQKLKELSKRSKRSSFDDQDEANASPESRGRSREISVQTIDPNDKSRKGGKRSLGHSNSNKENTMRKSVGFTEPTGLSSMLKSNGSLSRSPVRSAGRLNDSMRQTSPRR